MCLHVTKSIIFLSPGDIGGSIGLFVGASALSLFEIIDSLINTAFIHNNPNKHKTQWIAMSKNRNDQNGTNK